MSVRVWDITLILVALCAAGASAWYYVAAVVDRDRPLARLAGAAFFLFTTAPSANGAPLLPKRAGAHRRFHEVSAWGVFVVPCYYL